MDSTDFQQDHHHRHHHHQQQQQHQQQQEEEQQEQSYAYLGYSSLLESERRLSYGVSQSPPHHRLLGRQPNNQGGYTGASVEVPSASSGVTSEASTFSYHSISSNADDVGSPNFPSSFPGMIQNPNENNPWFSQLEPGRSYNNSFTSLLSANAANSANFLGQLGLTSCLSTAPPDSSCFLGLNLQASDFLSGGRQLSTYSDALAAEKDAGGLSWPSRSRALGLTKATSSAVNNNGAAGTKRPAAGGDFSDTSLKAPSLAVSNKKSASKTPFPPLKVRKEKLGDRIAALHQLVSPFGKTDTASVLTEAIGYIQFLQDQIHTLCMPNVKPLRNKPCGRTTQTVLGEDQQESKVDEEAAQDLRTRGLCLVPLSWTSFITADQMDAFMNNHHHYF